MNDLVIYSLIALVFGTILGFVLATFLSKSKLSTLEERLAQGEYQRKMTAEQLEKTNQEKESVREEKERVKNELTAKEIELQNLQARFREKDQELEQLNEKFTKNFQLIADDILKKNSDQFSKQNQEKLDMILKPLQEKIAHFEKRVEDTHKENIDRSAALREQIKGLTALNEQMSKEASNLTKALKGDSKMQGNWGELVLEKVLEKSGLEKDREYFVQQSFKNEDGRRVLPDVVIHLPDDKRMIIDSKVSLTAYERFVNEEEEDIREQALKAHIISLKRHVEQLSEKNYQDLYEMESPDFVLLFIPIEPAFAIAVNHDAELYNKAFERNIVIVTPATLLATLRTIDTMWNNEKQQRNALEIARQAGGLYDKFHGLVHDLTQVGKKMDDAKDNYKAAMNKLVEGNGNLIGRVERLKKMGAKAKKALPEKIVKRATDFEDEEESDT
ncbi:DNA recombination protein RmuC [Croceiramulus getboli]|nr:DNA recombination protein RmuC [Flavobacteriaceae bacterium YJPT1-3]